MALCRRIAATPLQGLNAEKIASIVRNHWQVENNLHWVLDVVLQDDACRYDKETSAFNITILKRLVMNMYKSDSSKRRLKSKIAQARYDEDYRERLLFG